MSLIIKPATEKDCVAFYGQRPMMSMRGYVAILDDKVIAIAGLYREDRNWIAFSEMKDEMRGFRKDIARAIRLLRSMFDAMKSPVFAVASQEESTSQALLSKIGFVSTGMIGKEGEVLIYKKDMG